MTQQLWIPGPLPGWREVLAAATSGHGRTNGYARLKAEWTNIVALHAKSARLKPVLKARLRFLWHEVRAGRKRGRDRGNVLAGEKFVADGLVVAQVLPDDGPDYVIGESHDWIYGDVKPGVLVVIESV